eukprot:TRINITY_DN628_c0_g3_i1.p1 TRINITY_DN628_c0_g3~~TRINITY_DN628_c0_g3_i1.p1  ORF type:complete len:463 (+),score=240.72 TRINITY_DN628_c0_g3_i1:73-1461(+)
MNKIFLICSIFALLISFVLTTPGVVSNVVTGQQCCNSRQVFNPSTQYCCAGIVGIINTATDTDQCCGNRPLRTNEICCNGRPFTQTGNLQCCGSSTINPTTQQCCGSTAFTTASQKCCDNGAIIPIARECCGTSGMNAGQQCCGNVGFDPATSTCCSFVQNGVTQNRVATGTGSCCGTNTQTVGVGQLCCPSADASNARIVTSAEGTLQCCGSSTFNPITQRCCPTSDFNAVVLVPPTGVNNPTCCTNGRTASLYDPEIRTCCTDTGASVAIDSDLGRTACCGTTAYDPEYQSCCSSRVVCGNQCCGNNGFWTQTEICCGGTVHQIINGFDSCCGSQPYNDETHVCCSGRLWEKVSSWVRGQCCADFYYNPDYRICCGATTVTNPDLNAAPVGQQFVRCGDTCCGTSGYFADFQKCCGGRIFDTDAGNSFQCCGASVYDTDDLTKLCCCDTTDSVVTFPECA